MHYGAFSLDEIKIFYKSGGVTTQQKFKIFYSVYIFFSKSIFSLKRIILRTRINNVNKYSNRNFPVKTVFEIFLKIKNISVRDNPTPVT